MANTVFKLRRSSVAGKVPTTTDIAIGELAINLTDRKLYSSDGSNTWEIGANLTSISVSANSTVNNIIISGGIFANGGFGNSGQVLTSNGSATYWTSSSGAGTVTQVNTGIGLTGGPITSSGTIEVVANSGIVANSSGVFVKAGNNVTVNSTGVHVIGSGYVRQSFTGNGSNTIFTISGGYTSNNLDVYVNGIRYNSSEVDVSSGTTITFTTAPLSGALIEVVGITAGVLNYTTVNTDLAYTWTNTHTFSNTVTLNAVSANGSLGTANQVLTTNGSVVYWANASGGSGGGSWIQKTSGYTAVKGEWIMCDTSSGAFTVTLPASPNTNDYVKINVGPVASTNNITIGRNGSTIMSLSENMTINDNNITVEFVYNGSTWRIA
jgi:hypothetical protein